MLALYTGCLGLAKPLGLVLALLGILALQLVIWGAGTVCFLSLIKELMR